jgi:hypothetical protein
MNEEKRVIRKEFTITTRESPAKQLRECLDSLSNSSWYYTHEWCFELVLEEVILTRPILTLLVQLLNEPLPKQPPTQR